MNKNTTMPFILGIIIVAALAFVLAWQNSKQQVLPTNQMPSLSTDEERTSSEDVATTDIIKVETNIDTAVKVKSSSVKGYTLAQVAVHNTKSDCWTTINGGVYNVTTWISNHPGGESAIMSLCGTDGSSTFNGKHGGQPRPVSELAGFKIGILKQ
jgi:cytochrome b involved in lipid metabolism